MGNDMTPAREAHLIRQAQTLSSLAELHAFRDQIKAQGEQITAGLFRAMESKATFLGAKERR
jgi:hypothetical protein